MLSTRISTMAMAPVKKAMEMGDPAKARAMASTKQTLAQRAFEEAFCSATKGVATTKSGFSLSSLIFSHRP